MKNGSIVKAALQQADGRIKHRPALVIAHIPPFKDLLLCGISSQLWNYEPTLDIQLTEDHPDFPQTGLVYPSVIRAGFLASIPQSHVLGELGVLSESLYQEVINNIIALLNESL